MFRKLDALFVWVIDVLEVLMVPNRLSFVLVMWLLFWLVICFVICDLSVVFIDFFLVLCLRVDVC